MRVQMLKSIVCVFILFHAASKFWIVYSYFLKGPRAGQSDVITQNLPGYPDNIKLNSRQNFYVGLGSVRYQGVSLLGPFLDLIGPYPAIKRFLTKVYFPLSYRSDIVEPEAKKLLMMVLQALKHRVKCCWIEKLLKELFKIFY